jgi:hypothetical protein
VFDDVDLAGLPSLGDGDGGGDAADLGTAAVVSVVRTEVLSLRTGPLLSVIQPGCPGFVGVSS